MLLWLLDLLIHSFRSSELRFLARARFQPEVASFSCGSYGCSAYVEFSLPPYPSCSHLEWPSSCCGVGSFLHILLRRRRLLFFFLCFWCFTAVWAYGSFRFGATTSIGFATSFLRFATLIFGGYCFELFCICSYVRGVATAPHFVYLWQHFSSYQNDEHLACSYACCACLHMLRVHLHTLWPI